MVLAEGMVFAGALRLEPETFLELLKVSPAGDGGLDTSAVIKEIRHRKLKGS
jgi:hypothetical protein